MAQQLIHAMLPRPTHDELARQAFVSSLQAHLSRSISPKLQKAYTHQIEPQFVREHQRSPQNHHEVRRAMQDCSCY